MIIWTTWLVGSGVGHWKEATVVQLTLQRLQQQSGRIVLRYQLVLSGTLPLRLTVGARRSRSENVAGGLAGHVTDHVPLCCNSHCKWLRWRYRASTLIRLVHRHSDDNIVAWNDLPSTVPRLRLHDRSTPGCCGEGRDTVRHCEEQPVSNDRCQIS